MELAANQRWWRGKKYKRRFQRLNINGKEIQESRPKIEHQGERKKERKQRLAGCSLLPSLLSCLPRLPPACPCVSRCCLRWLLSLLFVVAAWARCALALFLFLLLARYHNGRLLLHKHLLFFLLLLLVADHSCCFCSSPSWSVSTSHHRSLRRWVLFVCVCFFAPFCVSCGLRKGFIKLSSFARNSFRVPCWLFQAQ